jgi:hypothetical protein
MAYKFEVVDLRDTLIVPTTVVEEATSPEDAARIALGIDVTRSGAREDLVARVYWQARLSGPRNMVRLFAKSSARK